MKFAEHLYEEVLEEVEYFHPIFGVAKRVRPCGFSVWIGDAFSDKERELFVARLVSP